VCSSTNSISALDRGGMSAFRLRHLTFGRKISRTLLDNVFGPQNLCGLLEKSAFFKESNHDSSVVVTAQTILNRPPTFVIFFLIYYKIFKKCGIIIQNELPN
jgi:hypothetical protein